MISPAFPSAVNGLGDYSVLLGVELANQGGFEVIYSGPRQKENVTISDYVSFNNIKELIELVEKNHIDVIYLNYSNYGYSQKGIPFWLLKAVKVLKKQSVTIVIFFHELNASGQFFQSAFWLKPLQIYLYKNLYKLCSHAFCSNERIQHIMKTNDEGNKLKKIGVFSNIPEPKDFPPFSTREAVAIIFGSFGKRKKVYEKPATLNELIEMYGIKKIIDIGSGDINPFLAFVNAPVIIKGELNSAKISELMLSCTWGFLDYPDSLLGKSGIFAAYAAHQLGVINFYDQEEAPMDGLLKEVHYRSIDNGINDIGKKDYGQQLYYWYQNHNLQRHLDNVIYSISHCNSK